MCRHFEAHLPSDLASAAKARQLVRDQMGRWELVDPDGDVTLLVSELVTNAVTHTESEVALVLAVADGVLEVAVADSDPRDLRSASPQAGAAQPPLDDDAENGRGLHLVDAIADEWGIEHLAEGKEVWFRLAVDEAWPYRTSCPCHGAQLHETVLLRSGRRVRVGEPA